MCGFNVITAWPYISFLFPLMWRNNVPRKGELMVSQPKTHNSIRVLPVSQQAVELLVEEHKKRPGNPCLVLTFW